MSTLKKNRPGVAGPVVQTPPSLINEGCQSSFSSKSSTNHNFQSIRARDLKCVHTTCHLSCVSWFFFLQIDGGSQWRVCYQQGQGLRCLVFKRPSVTTAVLQTPPSLTDWLGWSVNHPFLPNFENTKASKSLELETWNFDKMFTICHMSCVTCCIFFYCNNLLD